MATTLADITLRCYERANMAYDDGVPQADRFVQDEEVRKLVNLAYSELYGELVRAGMHRTESLLVLTVNGDNFYPMEEDFFAVLSVHGVDDNGRRWELGRHNHHHRPDDSWNADAATYRMVGVEIEFSPNPASGTYEIRYIPVPGELEDPTDTVDGVLGWEEYLVLYVAIRLLQKEGSHDQAGPLKQDLLMLRARIQDEAHAAEMSSGNTVANVRWTRNASLPGDYTYSIRPRWGGW